GHQDKIRSITFSPEGRYFVSTSEDGTARLWDTQALTNNRLGARNVSNAQPHTESPKVAFTDESTIDDDGWIRGPEDELLIWIPEPHRLGLHRPSKVWITGPGRRETRL
ncbi:hypothetical protein C8R44DRAFT_681454, partial [Mycena epipterygia]